MDTQTIDLAIQFISEAEHLIALTGAGVSTESGIPDFRGTTGLWRRFNPAEYATLGAFVRDPAKVWNMLAELEALLDATPNAGHKALAEMERRGILRGIVTQNIDGLHQAAGSRNVVEFHGSNRTFTCLECGQRFPRDRVRAMPRRAGTRMPEPEACDARGGAVTGRCMLKPDVVFFDEMIPPAALAASDELVRAADLILVVGTSCEVYPAADIPARVRGRGGKIIEVNLDPAEGLRPDVVLRGKAAAVLPALAARLSPMEVHP